MQKETFVFCCILAEISNSRGLSVSLNAGYGKVGFEVVEDSLWPQGIDAWVHQAEFRSAEVGNPESCWTFRTNQIQILSVIAGGGSASGRHYRRLNQAGLGLRPVAHDVKPLLSWYSVYWTGIGLRSTSWKSTA